MTLGGAAQVAAAHCPNEQTLDPAVCSYNRPTNASPSRTMAFTRNVLRQRLTIFRSEYYQILIATHFIYLPRRDGRLSCSRLLLESGPGRTGTGP